MSNLTSQRASLYVNPAQSRLGSNEQSTAIRSGIFTTLVATSFSATTINATTINATSLSVTNFVATNLSSGSITASSTLGATNVTTSSFTTTTLNATTANVTTANVTGTFTSTGTVSGNFVVNTLGDLLTHNGTGLARLPKGTNGYVLTANSATATGLEWQTFAVPTAATPTTLGIVYGRVNTTNHNHSVGQGSLSGLTFGTNNVALGYNAGATTTTGNNNTYVGYGADSVGFGTSTQIVTGSSAVSAASAVWTIPDGVTVISIPGLSTVTSGSLLQMTGGSMGLMSVAMSAKGDLLTHSGSDNVIRTIGSSNNQILFADSTQTSGMAWRGFNYFYPMYFRYGLLASDTTIPTTTSVTLSITRNTVGAASWTLPVAGTYLFLGQITQQQAASGGTAYASIFLDSTEVVVNERAPNGVNNHAMQVCRIMNATSGQVLSLRYDQTSGSNRTVLSQVASTDPYTRETTFLMYVCLTV